MGGSFKIGRAFGIDVKVHWTFFLLLAFFGILGYAQTGNFLGAAVVADLILTLFVCVLLHEYAHALVARRLGVARLRRTGGIHRKQGGLRERKASG